MRIEKRLNEQLPDLERILEVIEDIPIEAWTVKRSKVKWLEPSLADHYTFIARCGKMIKLDRRGIYRVELKSPVPTAPRDWKDIANTNPRDIILPLGIYELTFSKGEKNHTEINTRFNGSIIWGDRINIAIRREYKRLLVAYAQHQTGQ